MLTRFDVFTRDNALPAIFLAFLIPGIPDDVLCLVAGLTEIDLWKLVTVSVVGRLPSFVLVSVVGVELANANLLTALTLAAVFLAIVAVAHRYRGAIVDRLARPCFRART